MFQSLRNVILRFLGFDQIDMLRMCRFKEFQSSFTPDAASHKSLVFENESGTLEVRKSERVLAVYFDSGVSKNCKGTFGIVAEQGKVPYVFVWPHESYRCDEGHCGPIYFSADGLNFPHRDGTRTILSLDEIGDMLKRLTEKAY